MKRKWTTLLPGSFVACVSIVAVSIGAAAVEIPAVKARDPNPLTSPRVVVHDVVIADFVEFPELGITSEAVYTFVRERLTALEEENRPVSHGFTARELDEVARLLDTMALDERRGGLTAREADDLANLVREQKSRKGVSIVALERLAAELGQFYRDHGLPLAVAYVPVQEVTNGRVTLAVQPGVLEQVVVQGDARFPKELIERAFADQQGVPVTHRRVEGALYQVNALPGLETEGRFVAGEAVGATRLDIRVRDERRLAGRVRVDNHGNERSGEQRLLGEIGWYNPTGGGDAVQLQAVAGNDPDRTVYGSARYERPLGDIRTVGHVRATSDTFEWQSGGTDVDGDSLIGAFGLRRDLKRSRVASVAVDGELAWQRLSLDPPQGDAPDDQRVVVASLGASTERVFDASEVALSGRAGVDLGSYLDGEPNDASSFARFTVDGYLWTLVGLPGIATQQTLGVRMGGQVATEPLPGTLQQSLAGAGRVSAFDPSLVSVDDGVYVGVDLRLSSGAPSRWGELWVFADAAYGEQKRSFDEDLWAYLSDVGLAWRIALPIGIEGELRWSLPLSAKGEDDDIDDDGARWLWMMSYQPRQVR